MRWRYAALQISVRFRISYEIEHITDTCYLSIPHMRKRCALTQLLVSDMPRRMGRKKQWAEDMQARFPEGTFSRISAALSDGEDRTDFVREAVDRELKRRERKAKADEAD